MSLFNHNTIYLLSPLQHLIFTQSVTKEKAPHAKKVYKKLDENKMAWEVEKVQLREPQTTEIEVYNGPWTPETRSLARPTVQQSVIFPYLWHFGQLVTSVIFIRTMLG